MKWLCDGFHESQWENMPHRAVDLSQSGDDDKSFVIYASSLTWKCSYSYSGNVYVSRFPGILISVISLWELSFLACARGVKLSGEINCFNESIRWN